MLFGDDDTAFGGEHDEALELEDTGYDEGLDDADDQAGAGGDAQHQALSDPEEQPREDAQAVKPSRAQARIEEATRRAREAEASAAELRQRLASIEATQSRATEEARERQALEQMDPYQRAEYIAQRAEQRTTNAISQLEARLADADDRAAFAAACARNPAMARVQAEVEKQLADSRANGVTVQRSMLAAYLIGQRVMERAPAARAKQAKTAAVNISRERGRPVAGGSDAQGGRAKGDDAAARRERLKGQTI